MSTEPLLQSSRLERGTYHPSGPSDLRGPCPFINSLANHGYIPRDGRNVHASDLMTAMTEAGISLSLRTVFAQPIFLEYRDPKSAASQPKPSFLARAWNFIRNPFAVLLAKFGMRKPGQKDSANRNVLNLDQLATHAVIEHDVSLTRRDFAQGNNRTPQPDLVQELLDSSSYGKKLTAEDLAGLRRRRIEQQKKDNPALNYGTYENRVACGEIALILGVFGDGKSVPLEHARAIFAEERLPVKEGWKKRSWWRPMGLMEFGSATSKMQNLVGFKG